MNPYRTPTPSAADERGDARASWDETFIYGTSLAFGIAGLLDALRGASAVGAVNTLAILVGSWGARALAIRAWRRRNTPV